MKKLILIGGDLAAGKSTFRKLSENPRLLNCRDESLYKFYQKQLLTLNY